MRSNTPEAAVASTAEVSPPCSDCRRTGRQPPAARRGSNCLLLFLLLSLLSFISSCQYASGSPDGNAKKSLPHIDSVTFNQLMSHKHDDLCKRDSPHLSNPRVLHFCSDGSHAQRLAQIGMHEGLKTCREIFKNQRWNCKFRHQFLDTGFPHSGFVWAMAVSKAVEELVSACRRGDADLGCSCGNYDTWGNADAIGASMKRKPQQLQQLDLTQKREKKQGNDVMQHRCQDGMRVVSRWVQIFMGDHLGVHPDSDLLHKVNYHNRRAALMIVPRSTEKTCSCMGTSGSCARKVCAVTLKRNSKKLVENLLQLLADSQFVKAVGRKGRRRKAARRKAARRKAARRKAARRKAARRRRLGLWRLRPRLRRKVGEKWKRVSRRSLVHVAEVPENLCVANVSAGILGTAGRVCDPSKAAGVAGGCVHLCCNAGSHTRIEVQRTHCKCHLSYGKGIDMVCKVCERYEIVTRCKLLTLPTRSAGGRRANN